MADETHTNPDTDRFAYSRAALSRLALSYEQRDLAVQAAAGVPTDDSFARPGDLVEEAQNLVDRAQDVLRWAVIHERQKGTSWDEIGERLGGITRQSAHERFKAAVEEWQLSLLDPHFASTGGYRPLRLHEAAYDPTRTGQQLDAWVRDHVAAYRDTPHPVTGRLPALTIPEEMVQVLDAIQHLQKTDASATERAEVYERKAALLDRIAAEEDKPEAAEQAADARARASQLRQQQ